MLARSLGRMGNVSHVWRVLSASAGELRELWRVQREIEALLAYSPAMQTPLTARTVAHSRLICYYPSASVYTRETRAASPLNGVGIAL